MMTEAVMVAIVAALGAILAELIRARRRADTVVHAVTPNSGTSMRDAVDRIARELGEMRTEHNKHANRLAGIEAILNERRR